MVVWSRERAAYLWRPDDGNTAVELVGQNSALGPPSFSSDGRFVLTFDESWSRAWDAAAPGGRIVVELPIDSGGARTRPGVGAQSWSADGRQLAVAWDDGQIELHSCEVCRSFDKVIDMAKRRQRFDRPLTDEEWQNFIEKR